MLLFTHRRADPVVELSDQFSRTHSSLCDDSLAPPVQNLFGQRVTTDVDRVFGFGKSRSQVDLHIAATAITMMDGRDDEEPLQILEIGAGVSYALSPSVGSPWLARSLAMAFPDRCFVTTTDKIEAKSRFVVMTVDEENRLHSEHRNPFAFSLTSPVDQSAVVRPIIDSEFERDTFGVNAIGGVSFEELSSTFPGQKFDLIFGRHLEPMGSGFPRDIEAQIEPILKDSGQSLIACDVGYRQKVQQSPYLTYPTIDINAVVERLGGLRA